MAARLRGRRAGPAAALVGLSLLWALGSLRRDWLPGVFGAAEALPAFERQALEWAGLAVLAAGVAVARRVQWPHGQGAGKAALVGLGLFVAPAVLVHAAGAWVGELTRVALFSLTPVFAVVLEAHLGAMKSRGGLLPPLAALAGVLCVFPVELPGSVEAGLASGAVLLAALCAATSNCWAVRVVSDDAEWAAAPWAAVAAAAAALGFGVLSGCGERVVTPRGLGPEIVWLALVDLPALLALFWLMRRMTAARMTLRFVLAPLLASVASLAVLRPAVSTRSVLGLALMAAGAAWMLAGREDEDTEALPLNLDRR